MGGKAPHRGLLASPSPEACLRASLWGGGPKACGLSPLPITPEEKKFESIPLPFVLPTGKTAGEGVQKPAGFLPSLKFLSKSPFAGWQATRRTFSAVFFDCGKENPQKRNRRINSYPSQLPVYK